MRHRQRFRSVNENGKQHRSVASATAFPCGFAHVGKTDNSNKWMITIDGVKVSLPPLIGPANGDGVCNIGLPPHSTFSLSEVRSEFLYIVMFGRLTSMPDEFDPDVGTSPHDEIRIFRPGDILDGRNLHLLPLTMETVTWTELARLPYARLTGNIVRQMRRRALLASPIHNAARYALHTSKNLVSSNDKLNSHRLTALSGWIGNGPEPMITAMMRDPIIRLVMRSDGVTETDILKAVRKMRQS